MRSQKLDGLLEEYLQKRDAIRSRLEEFEDTWRKGDREIFRELCFCILTANASAQMGINCIEGMGDSIFTGTIKDVQNLLRGRHRYWRIRASYIVSTREYLEESIGLRLKEKIKSMTEFHERRDYFASNKGIKGLGYKEASHFLRNIGFKGYTILDKHILRTLNEFGVINGIGSPNTRKRYLVIEEKMHRFANHIGIDVDELDLLLWSRKTGKILK